MRMKLAAALLTAILLLTVFSACAEDADGLRTEIPELLRFSQTDKVQKIAKNVEIRRTLPVTANADVNAAVADTVERLVERNSAALPDKGRKVLWDLDVGPYVYRTGTSWMSFLTTASLAVDAKQISVDYECHVYDIATGEELHLTDVFASGSPAWELIRSAAREQLTAYYPDLEADPAALEALLTDEALAQADFTMGIARIMLTWRADTLYPEKQTLMHVYVSYADVRPYMTNRAQAQTDNSKCRVIALTFDDGPALYSTRQVINALRNHGAQATFYCIGFRLQQNPFNVARVTDAGFSVGSHTWFHKMDLKRDANALKADTERFNNELIGIMGLPAGTIRAPGGKAIAFARAGLGLPIINWASLSGDGSGTGDPASWTRKLTSTVQPGDIVLLHDLKTEAGDEIRRILPWLDKNGYFCVTLEELYLHYGVPLVPDEIHYTPR